jgi:hypothetical protein
MLDDMARQQTPIADFAAVHAGERRHKGRGRSKRAVFLTWLRKIHLYVGLWGAVLGLLFGVTGIVLNHRAVLKLPIEKTVQKTVQVSLPAQVPDTPERMGDWLKQELHFESAKAVLVRRTPPQDVIWNEQSVKQPEKWTINLNSPGRGVQAEYFVGNRYARVELIDATPIGTLTRLHMSVGASAFWVLLADTIAGSLILLSLTGLLLWTQLHTVRSIAVLASLGALTTAMFYMWAL